MSVVLVGQIMIVVMRMRDRMRVRRSVVRVRKGVYVQMRMIPFQRIDYDQRRAAEHHEQCGEVQPRKPLAEDQKRQQRADKRPTA